MVTDADGDALAQELILNRSFCYPFRKGPSTDPSLPSLGPFSSDVQGFVILVQLELMQFIVTVIR